MPIIVGVSTGSALVICGALFSYLGGYWGTFELACKFAAVVAPASAISTAVEEYFR